MSWQAYVDTNLLGTGKVSKAAIVGQQGGVWAQSAGFELSTAEQNAAIQAFVNPEKALETGIVLAGKKFFVFQADDKHIYGKKGADGCVLVKTTQAILVTEYLSPIQQQESVSIVEALGDYLKGVGY